MGVLWDLFGNPNGQVFALPVRWHQQPLGSLSGYKYLDNHLQTELLQARGLILLHHSHPQFSTVHGTKLVFRKYLWNE